MKIILACLLIASMALTAEAVKSKEMGEKKVPAAGELLMNELIKVYQKGVKKAVAEYNSGGNGEELKREISKVSEFHFLKPSLANFNKQKIKMEEGLYTLRYPDNKFQFNAYTLLGKYVLVNGKKFELGSNPLENFERLKTALDASERIVFSGFFIKDAHAQEAGKELEHNILLAVISVSLGLSELPTGFFSIGLGAEKRAIARANMGLIASTTALLANACERGEPLNDGIESFSNERSLSRFTANLMNFFENDRARNREQEDFENSFRNEFRRENGRHMLSCDAIFRHLYPCSGTGSSSAGYGYNRIMCAQNRAGGALSAADYAQAKCNEDYARLETCLVSRQAELPNTVQENLEEAEGDGVYNLDGEGYKVQQN